MNYTEVVKKIAEETKISKADVGRVLKALSVVISESLAESDERVRISNIGSFYKSEIAERTYTGGACAGKTSPAHYRVKFEPAKALKDSLPKIEKAKKVKAKSKKKK